MAVYLVQVMNEKLCACMCVSLSDRFSRREGLTVPGGSLMSHGNSDVMESQPQLDLPASVCVRIKSKSKRKTVYLGIKLQEIGDGQQEEEN